MDMEYESKWFDEFVATMDIGLMLEEADKKSQNTTIRLLKSFPEDWLILGIRS